MILDQVDVRLSDFLIMNRSKSRPSILLWVVLVLSVVLAIAAVFYIAMPSEARYEVQLESARLIERTARQHGWSHLERLAFQKREEARLNSLDLAVKRGELIKLKFIARPKLKLQEFFSDFNAFVRTNSYRMRFLSSVGLGSGTNEISMWLETPDATAVQMHIEAQYPELKPVDR